MAKMLWVFFGGAVIGGGASLALAADRPAVVYSNSIRYAHPDGLNQSAYRVVTRSVADPAAVVSRELAVQPTWTHKIELQVANTTVYLDPHDADLHMRLRRLGRGHSFIKAVEMWAASHGATPARVIQSPHAQPAQAMGRVVAPLFIIQKPGVTPDGNPAPMPNTPKAPEKETKPLLAHAEAID